MKGIDGFTVVLPGASPVRARARIVTRRSRDWRDGLPLLEVTLTPEDARRLGLRVRAGESAQASLRALGYDLPPEGVELAPHLSAVLRTHGLPAGYTVGSVDRWLTRNGLRHAALTYRTSRRIVVSELATPDQQAAALREAIAKLHAANADR